jgi:PPOX class probable F420-dependent enzyme
MTLVERLADLQYRALDRARHRRAFEVAHEPGTATSFDSLRGARQCLIVTVKRSGEPVPTPVNFGLGDGKLYFRSEPRSAKVRRIQRDPRVRVCACNIRGKPSGPVVEGRARVLTQAESTEAEGAVAGNWSAAMRPLERGLEVLPVEMVYVEVVPAEDGMGAA